MIGAVASVAHELRHRLMLAMARIRKAAAMPERTGEPRGAVPSGEATRPDATLWAPLARLPGGTRVPSFTRLIRFVTLPETRHLLAAARRSDEVRRLLRRARSDRSGLARELADPRKTAGLARQAIVHPATLELANVGLAMLPLRYLPVGWVATRLSRRLMRRSAATKPSAQAWGAPAGPSPASIPEADADPAD